MPRPLWSLRSVNRHHPYAAGTRGSTRVKEE
jgi:hypothetical protein